MNSASGIPVCVWVGSTNRVKIEAAQLAIQSVWPDCQVHSVDVQGGVAAQPLSDADTRRGAEERARQALAYGLTQQDTPSTDRLVNTTRPIILGLGFEGGATEVDGELWCTVWAAVASSNADRIFVSNGARFPFDQLVTNRLRAGAELGPLMDELSRQSNTREKGGAIEFFTQGVVDRTHLYAPIASVALGLWYGRDWQHRLK